jgi:hypothetical protein
MVAYLLFRILCVLLLRVTGSFGFVLWLGGTVFVLCWSNNRDVFRMLYRAWDRATTDKEG